MRAPRKVWLVLGLLVFIGLIPLLMARWVYQNASHLTVRKKHHGVLIKPQDVAKWSVLSGKKSYPLSHLAGHWLLVYDTQDHCCEAACQENMHRLRSVRVALHNGWERTWSVLLMPAHCPAPTLDKGHIILRSSASSRGDWASIQSADGKPQFVIVDPRSYLMMRYPGDSQSRGIYEDMRILLHASRTGG